MKHLFLSVVTLLFFLLCSCGDEVEGRIEIDDSAPSKVSNVNTSPGPGEVYLSWQIPTDASFMYTKIEYINSKGDVKYKLVSKERIDENNISRDTIRGFADTEAKTFSLIACSVRGNNQGTVEVSESPETPAFVEIIKTVSLEEDLGGINVLWENVYNTKAVFIVLNYSSKNDPTKKGTAKFQLEGERNGVKYVPLTYGSEGDFLSGEECNVSITTEDEAENVSESRTFTVIPKAVIKISRANWSFPGYTDSNDETIGYSSQEAGGEGASPNGRVIAMIDDNPNTFWHASWKVASAYPHWFILDMGKDITVSSVELTRRLGDERGQKGQIIYTCPESGAGNQSDPTSWLWENHGSFSFDSSTDAPQAYRLTSNPVTRYIKVYFGEEHKGSGSQAMLSQINVYGSEE